MSHYFFIGIIIKLAPNIPIRLSLINGIYQNECTDIFIAKLMQNPLYIALNGFLMGIPIFHNNRSTFYQNLYSFPLSK